MKPAFPGSVLCVLGLVSLCACVKVPIASSPRAGQFVPALETGPYVVIGHLEHRDRIVTIKSGDTGTVYSVTNKDGKTLYENLTAEQLKAQSPEIHDFIEAATAGSAAF